MTTEELAAHAIDRIKGIMFNHPKKQYVRLTRGEAEAIVAVHNKKAARA